MVDKYIEFVLTALLYFWGFIMKGVLYVGLTGLALYLILFLPLYSHLKRNGL